MTAECTRCGQVAGPCCSEVERFADDRDQYRGQIARLFRERDAALAAATSVREQIAAEIEAERDRLYPYSFTNTVTQLFRAVIRDDIRIVRGRP